LQIQLLFVYSFGKEMAIYRGVEPRYTMDQSMHGALPALMHLGGRCHRPAMLEQSRHCYFEHRQSHSNLRPTQSWRVQAVTQDVMS
jgi:hypothetical protein